MVFIKSGRLAPWDALNRPMQSSIDRNNYHKRGLLSDKKRGCRFRIVFKMLDFYVGFWVRTGQPYFLLCQIHT